MKLDFVHLIPSVFTCIIGLLDYVFKSTAFSLNFAPAKTSSSTFLVKIAVSENDVVICPVLFLDIIMTGKTSEIRATLKTVYKT